MKYFIILVSLIYSSCFSFTFAKTKPEFQFALGADVSWLTEMEAAGKKFYAADGTQMECMALLKSLGMNSIRLRVWVNPTDSWCNAADLLVKAKRANDLGMRIMIDFHYSDWWADPGKQNKPAAWTLLSLTDLKTAVANHTREVLNLLKNNNITPEWVQVGNETSNGMLWDTGKASVSMSNYTALNNAGFDAVKEVFPTAKVIVHLHNGYDNAMFRWIFDGLKANGGKWDIIGMSLYPSWYKTANDWQNANKDCLANMNDMVSRYGKVVMIVECGMSWDNAATSKLFLTDLIYKTKQVTGGLGTGILYWEPKCYGNWQGYSLGAFDNGGKPTIALDAFKNTTQLPKTTLNKLKYNIDRVNKTIVFDKPIKGIDVFDAKGVLIQTSSNKNYIELNKLSKGVNIINIRELESNDLITFKYTND